MFDLNLDHYFPHESAQSLASPQTQVSCWVSNWCSCDLITNKFQVRVLD